MGRTNPTFRDVVERVRRRWEPFRRGLRREEQAAFDEVLAKAGAHADAAGYANPTEPVVLVLLSVLVEQQRDLSAAEEWLADVEARLDAIEADCDGTDRNGDGRDGDGRGTDDEPHRDGPDRDPAREATGVETGDRELAAVIDEFVR